MTVPASILVYGNDALLVRTRAQVLEGAGFDVLSATTEEDAQSGLVSAPVALVVLCHSLSAGKRDSFAKFVRAERPRVATLVLTAGGPVAVEPIGGGTVLSIFEGPAKLVETVQQIVSAG